MLVNHIQHVHASYIQIHSKVRSSGLHQVYVVHDPDGHKVRKGTIFLCQKLGLVVADI
jgi:hypothetical protein